MWPPLPLNSPLFVEHLTTLQLVLDIARRSLLDDVIGNRTLSRTDEVMRALLELDTTRVRCALPLFQRVRTTAHGPFGASPAVMHCAIIAGHLAVQPAGPVADGAPDRLFAPLRAAGPVETVAQSATVDLREYCLLEYGSMLLAHPVHWQAGVAYLRSSPVLGLATLETVRCRRHETRTP